MEQKNGNSFTGFILLGFSDRPQLEQVLFVVLLISYIFTLLRNITVIPLSYLDPRLHTPIYFFLSNLSFLDLHYITSIVPPFLVNLSGADKSISFCGYVAQFFVDLGLGCTECFLLVFLAFNPYAAVCMPLHYTVIMHPCLCALMTSASWIIGFANSLLQTVYIFLITLCGRNKLDHFLCEIPPFLKLGCVDTTMNVCDLLWQCHHSCLNHVLLRSDCQGGLKNKVHFILKRNRVGTCGSHLMVVSLLFGTAIYVYRQPSSNDSQDQNKFMSLFYTVIIPMTNPLICTLRNRDVKGG